MSQPMQVFHGDRIQLGGTTLEFHIHPGNETCDGCEPGNVQAEMKKEEQEAAASMCAVIDVFVFLVFPTISVKFLWKERDKSYQQIFVNYVR